MTSQCRCAWVPTDDPLYITYHDEEWGVPEYDDRRLFEMLLLEGAQAGLSWITILRKRENYRRAFDGFDAEKIARYKPKKIASLLDDSGIVRNRLKVNTAVTNAQLFLDVQNEYGSFSDYLWQFVDGKPIINTWQSPEKTRLQVCRLHHLLCLYAVTGNGQRPHHGLLSLSASECVKCSRSVSPTFPCIPLGF